MYRFMLSARWIGFAIFVIVLAALCTRLGFWQMHKLELRLDRNDIITQHFSTDPVDIDTAMPPGSAVDKTNEWTRVSATGTYDVDQQLTVKFTTRDGAPGVDVVTPLVLPSGDALLVDRGWMETQNTVKRPKVPAPPTGEVTVEGWLRQNNGAGGAAVRPSEGQIRAISSDALGQVMPYDLVDGYVNLQAEKPAPATALAAEPKPELGQGPHFFYALQWWFFALLATVGYFWFARAEAKERRNPTRLDGFADQPGKKPRQSNFPTPA
ncbi:SURF1 family cytochrome oxidase biogenesis protein [Aeromicrobium fastidiosum]|uniref:SURF1-like protein n=1 Tax=Aeromicrobium fastidiosum TaxID=52699 RepID=A0A641AK13_9ACTN|nr:SURF1 family protein [Aeromicrobium fastidiosum]KAA1376020.1 SURF1 family protein [Aeromicrobium fastidiosum]MBP2392112.1 cytochrome oxidase assembly protein ShyY1 [Aeromicrobium fastidiosum]